MDDKIAAAPEESAVLSALIGALVDQKGEPSREEKLEICGQAIKMAKELRNTPDERKVSTSKSWAGYLLGGGMIVTAAIITLLKGKK